MALSPIQMFQNDQSSLAQILQGGNQTLSGILDKAVQIGRDMSNNQTQNEHDMIGMRQQETSLMQRRADNLQQNNEDAQRFARNAFESDRNYGLQSSTQQFNQNRAGAQDLLAQSNSDRNYGLAKDAGTRQGTELTLRTDAAAEAKRRAAANDLYYQEAAGGAPLNANPAVGQLPDTGVTTPNMVDSFNQPADSRIATANRMFDVAPTPAEPAPTDSVANMLNGPGPTTTATPDLSQLQAAVAKTKAIHDGAIRDKQPPQRIADLAAEMGTAKGALDDFVSKQPLKQRPPTPLSTEAARLQGLNLAAAEAKARDDNFTNLVNDNPSVFPSSAADSERNLNVKAAAAGKDPRAYLYSSEVPDDVRKNIIDSQKGQSAIELGAINRLSEDAYMALAPKGLSQEQLASRRAAYQMIKGAATPPAATPAAATTPDPQLTTAQSNEELIKRLQQQPK